MTSANLFHARWRKSSRSGQNGNCVEIATVPTRVVTWRKSIRSGNNGGDCIEVAPLHHAVAVRDSKDPTGPVLMLSRADWRIFTEAVKRR